MRTDRPIHCRITGSSPTQGMSIDCKIMSRISKEVLLYVEMLSRRESRDASGRARVLGGRHAVLRSTRSVPFSSPAFELPRSSTGCALVRRVACWRLLHCAQTATFIVLGCRAHATGATRHPATRRIGRAPIADTQSVARHLLTLQDRTRRSERRESGRAHDNVIALAVVSLVRLQPRSAKLNLEVILSILGDAFRLGLEAWKRRGAGET